MSPDTVLATTNVAMDYVSAVILDWDDTILPSTWIAMSGHSLAGPFQCDAVDQKDLHALEDSTIEFFEHILRYEDLSCFIITNSEHGWVELSCEKFMPRVCPYLSCSTRIKIISARTLYEPMYPNEPTLWKRVAFLSEIEALHKSRLQYWKEQNQLRQTNRILEGGTYEGQNAQIEYTIPKQNIISFGDSTHERKALETVKNTFQNSITKNIKFIERPTIRQIMIQLQLMTMYFQQLYSSEEHLDLMLSLNVVRDPMPIQVEEGIHYPVQLQTTATMP